MDETSAPTMAENAQPTGERSQPADARDDGVQLPASLTVSASSSALNMTGKLGATPLAVIHENAVLSMTNVSKEQTLAGVDLQTARSQHQSSEGDEANGDQAQMANESALRGSNSSYDEMKSASNPQADLPKPKRLSNDSTTAPLAIRIPANLSNAVPPTASESKPQTSPEKSSHSCAPLSFSVLSSPSSAVPLMDPYGSSHKIQRADSSVMSADTASLAGSTKLESFRTFGTLRSTGKGAPSPLAADSKSAAGTTSQGQSNTLNSSKPSSNSFLAMARKDNQVASTTPTKARRLSIGAALMMPPPPRVNEKMNLKTVVTFAVSALGVLYGDLAAAPLFVVKPLIKGTLPRNIINAESTLASSLLAYNAVNSRSSASTTIPTNLSIDRDFYEIGVYGVTSLMIWLFVILSIKYMLLVFKAENNGEGGMLAMMSLIPGPEEEASTPFLKRTFKMTGIFGILGCAFLLGDGMIAPSISILGALEGLIVIEQKYDGIFSVHTSTFIAPTACVVLFLVFYSQQFGLGKWSVLFAPIMMLWFITIGSLGLYNIALHPNILYAFNPGYIVQLLGTRSVIQSTEVLAIAVIIIAGMEFIYADIGIFKRKPIYVSYGVIVFPCLLANYIGQGAKLLSLDTSPPHLIEALETINHIFFECAPSYVSMTLVGAVVSSLASQAIISGCFALMDQAISLRVFPPFETQRIVRESHTTTYVPIFNKFLFIGSIILTLAFRDSELLGGIYGVSVTGAMLITSILLMYVMQFKWRSITWRLVAYSAILLLDTILFVCTLTKVVNYAWISIIISFSIFLVMYVYSSTYTDLNVALEEELWAMKIARSHFRNHPRVKGLGIFLSDNDEEVPWVFSLLASRLPALPEEIIMLTVQCIKSSPFISEEDRYTMRSVDPSVGLFRLLISHGFAERSVDIQAAIAKRMKVKNEDSTTFFVSRQSVTPNLKSSYWHHFKVRFFEIITRNTPNQAKAYKFPPKDVLEVSSSVML